MVGARYRHQGSASGEEERYDVMSRYPELEALLRESISMHGHQCPGQVLGVRMSLLGLRSIGINSPKGREGRNLIVFVETDRCATDAIQSVTGCSLGRRTMKFVDYGKMAATFVNLGTGQAVRVVAREEARTKAQEYFPDMEDKYRAQFEAYKVMTDEELFSMMEVVVTIPPHDMPGRPLGRTRCSRCGEHVQDLREVGLNGEVLFRACAAGAYYTPVRTGAFAGGITHCPEQDCDFCKCADSGAKIIENEHAFCQLDNHPFSQGHSLVIPKRHFADYFDASKIERDAIQDLLHVRRQQLRETDPTIEGFNVGVNSGAVAGQTVFHCHVHLIPRRKGELNDNRSGIRAMINTGNWCR
jgi:formylmethanofuran dehydrogenase subunit E